MTIPILPDYVAPFKPVPQVTPFTYRDGVTMLKKLEDLKRYLNRVIVPFINDEFKKLGDDFETQVNILVDAVNAAIEAIVNDSIEVQDPIVAQLIADTESLTHNAILALFSGTYVETDQLDTETSTIINNDASTTSTAIDNRVGELLVVLDSATRTAIDLIIADNLSGYETIKGVRGVTRTIYVRSTGSDTTGDGTTTGTAYREIRKALESLAELGPVIRGSIVIDVGPGTYKGQISLPNTRFRAQDDFIKIIGPDVGGHPNVPTAIVAFSADNTATYGVQVLNGSTLWIENLKFTGGFDIAVDTRINSVLQSRNVHVDGENVGKNGFSFLTHCTYDMRGGIIENLVEHGIQEHFGITRTFDNVTIAAQATIIRNCAVGLFAKEDCNGHLDFVTFDDNGTGIEFHAWTTANLKQCTFTRNDVGILLVNSEIHNEQAVTWGTGATANTRRLVSLGNSDELKSFGWSTANPLTIAVGHRPLKQVAGTYVDATHTGVTTEILAYQSDPVIPAGRLSVQGRHIKVVVWLSIVTAPVTNSRVVLRLGGQLAAQVPLPAQAIAGMDMKVEFDVVCSADGNNQKSLGTVNGFVPGTNAYTITNVNLSDADFSVAVGIIHAEAASSITTRAVEVWA